MSTSPRTPSTDASRSPSPEMPAATGEVKLTSSLEELQTDEQRRVLDTVAQVRKCGLDSLVSLPQLVVCGDQSAGKSSALEALTGVPFPRSDNLCTRFATEIILRRANVKTLTIKIIPDTTRSASEQSTMKVFRESITDYAELPRIMDLAKTAMGLNNSESNTTARAFAKDVLSLEICGPNEPNLTLVDIPGLIATSSKGVTKADVDLVAEITDYWIEQPRTICLAVVSATYDYSNQKILQKVREVDPNGDRTLGIITKPDGLAAGSGAETSYIELAQNKDIFFKLGWHVLKNRKFEEREFNLMERNASEATYFRTSNFKCLPTDCVGIDTLRSRLSVLLFEHVKRELPKLRKDLDTALSEARDQFGVLGKARSSPSECKMYLAELSLGYHNICSAAINGHYEQAYFRGGADQTFDLSLPATIRRTRAVIQYLNTKFAEEMRTKGKLYEIDSRDLGIGKSSKKEKDASKPHHLSRAEALKWVHEVIVRTRGKELIGNFNPLVIGELFWEQSSKWEQLAAAHVDRVVNVCNRFLKTLLHDKCPQDVATRVWSSIIDDALNTRVAAAYKELEQLVEEEKEYPINYNHYYTETITARRLERHKASLKKCVKDCTSQKQVEGYDEDEEVFTTTVDIDQAISDFFLDADPNMEDFSCEEALDCLMGIYHVRIPSLWHIVNSG